MPALSYYAILLFPSRKRSFSVDVGGWRGGEELSFLDRHSMLRLASFKEHPPQHVDGCFRSCNLRWDSHPLQADMSCLPRAGQRLNRVWCIICECEWTGGLESIL